MPRNTLDGATAGAEAPVRSAACGPPTRPECTLPPRAPSLPSSPKSRLEGVEQHTTMHDNEVRLSRDNIGAVKEDAIAHEVCTANSTTHDRTDMTQPMIDETTSLPGNSQEPIPSETHEQVDRHHDATQPENDEETDAPSDAHNPMKNMNASSTTTTSPAKLEQEERQEECIKIKKLKLVDLCSGGGGIALAARQLGIEQATLIDHDQQRAYTLKRNGFTKVRMEPLADINFQEFRGIDVLTGTINVKPWQITGKSSGTHDPRDRWNHTIRAIRDAQPKLVIIATTSSFLKSKGKHAKLEVESKIQELGYQTNFQGANTADYGLAQDRRLCLLIAHKRDDHHPQPPPPVPRGERIPVRRALQSLGLLGATAKMAEGRRIVPARPYECASASSLDAPARPLTAAVDEQGQTSNTLETDDGTVRQFTMAEMATLQGFPQDHVFHWNKTLATKEICHSCPPPVMKYWLEQLIPAIVYDQVKPAKGPADATSQPEAKANDTTKNSDGISRFAWTELNKLQDLIPILQLQMHCAARRLSDALYQQGNFATELAQAVIERLDQQQAEDEERVEAVLRAPTRRTIRNTLAEILAKKEQPVSQAALPATASEEEEQRLTLACECAYELGQILEQINDASSRQRVMQLGLSQEWLDTTERDEQDPLAKQRDEAYYDLLDASLPNQQSLLEEAVQNLPQTLSDGRELTNCRKLMLRLPRNLVMPDQHPEAEDHDINFFKRDESQHRYNSLKANLEIEDPNPEGTIRHSIVSIVDSGAAWCAMRYSTLQTKFPHLAKQLRSTGHRFKDASGNRMSVKGVVPLNLWIGNERITTTCFVFEHLSADFLLGINALHANGCVIDLYHNRLYVHSDRAGAGHADTHCTQCAEKAIAITSPCCDGCTPPEDGQLYRMVCDATGCRLVLQQEEKTVASLDCTRVKVRRKLRLENEEALVLEPNAISTLALPMRGVAKNRLTPVEVELCKTTLTKYGLYVPDCQLNVLVNPRSSQALIQVRNPTADRIEIEPGQLWAEEVSHADSSTKHDTVLVAAILDDEHIEEPLKPLEQGGLAQLKALGFNLDHAIDPDQRREDGSYEPLSEAKKMILYGIAHRYHYVWARDAKVPRTSYLVVIDIPTGDAAPIAQQPYGIPAKLRTPVMDEINKLLKAGLIEPSMSDWASPTLVTVKKDSTPEDPKIKLAIDYRRVNAVTTADAGGLGTQADILYGIGGRFKYLGLADAAGGFYQYLLSPAARVKSAFILPSSMGGTLFQWRVAPYGLCRNPAGYSRGMQWVLKGLHHCKDLGGTSGEGGATSWLDDICMRATSFDGFADLFERVLSRLAMAGMSLKGPKCELLLPRCDILGFVATPHGLMIQKPKIKKILNDQAPRNASSAMTFLGAVAFLRRLVPRVSLLAAPMTAAIKSYEKRRNASKPAKTKRRRRDNEGRFTPEEQKMSDDSWNAILDHLDESAVVSSPEFMDPLAEFVMCTDASDYAVGGALMQWQHPNHLKGERGPTPPDGADFRATKGEDGISTHWRKKSGWELKIIGYYSKTLNDAQRNYPAFDRESGAILLCCRHWADLITYHPTTIYTDSSVATSMLTKHAAPPRLQRWGSELATFLPHLKIGYRKGVENGLADLLSRYQSFEPFLPNLNKKEEVELPEDYFDYIGTAPLYHRIPCSRPSSVDTPSTTPESAGGNTKDQASQLPPRDRKYLSSSEFALYDLRAPHTPEPNFWCAGGAPEIPGRGMKDRIAHSQTAAADQNDEDQVTAIHTDPEGADGERMINALTTIVANHIYSLEDQAYPRAVHWQRFVETFYNTYERWPTVRTNVPTDLLPTVRHEIERAGCIPISSADHLQADVELYCGQPPECADDDVSQIILSPHHLDAESIGCISLNRHSYSVKGNLRTPLEAQHTLAGYYAPPVAFRSLIAQAVAELLHRRHGIPLDSDVSPNSLRANLMDHWSSQGLGPLSVLDSPPQSDPYDAIDMCPIIDVAEEEGRHPPDATDTSPSTSAIREPEFSWQNTDHAWDPAAFPTCEITLEEQLKDPAIRLIADALKGDRRISRAKRQRTADRYSLKSGIIYRHVLQDGEPSLAIVVPNHLRAAKLALAHYSMGLNAGHSGGQNLYDGLSQDHYWPGMERECQLFADACDHCGGNKSRPTIKIPTAIAPTPARPFEVIHVDHKGTLPLSGGYNHVLVVVCALTRFTLYIPVKSTSGRATLDALITNVFSIFGYPLVIVSDNGSHLANSLMQASERLFGFRRIFVLPHTPQANGVAEAAVKKLKIIFDRHTDEYQDWHFLIPMAQATINQRITSGLGITPYQALFGRQAVSLSAIENPDLLPEASPEQKDVRSMARTIQRLQNRLRQVSDDIKQAAAAQQPPVPVGRPVVPGDKIWLNYSDSEKSRYLRKHGKGRPWKHPFVVKEVRPHAVRLEIPKDGSAPAVRQWQSLRKCSFAAPHFHSDNLPIPRVDHLHLPLADSSDTEGEEAPQPAQPAADPADPNGWEAWRSAPDTRYEIERIVSAERVPGGWRLHVKWKDYPDPTPEPMHRILRDCRDQQILADIELAKENYDAEHPKAQQILDPEVYEPAEPTRIQPARERRKPDRTIFVVHNANAPQEVLQQRLLSLQQLRSHYASVASAVSLIANDFVSVGLTSTAAMAA